MTELVLRHVGGLRQGMQHLATVWAMIVLIPLVVLLLDPGKLQPILTTAVSSFMSTLPYIASAVLIVAYLKATGAESVVAMAFEGRETRMIVLASVFGGLAPFCSCEVIPFIAGLLALGAPLSAVMAFWLSSPLSDPPSMLITAGALGWEFAIGKLVAAVAMGLLGGFGVKVLSGRGLFADCLRPQAPGGCCATVSPFEGRPLWRFWVAPERIATFRSQATENALFLIKWLALAYLLEGLLVTYIPAETIGQVVGGEGVIPIVIGALVGAPAYLNGYAAPALVAGLMEQGMSAGAAMSFMVAGAVSCVPAMAAVWSLVHRPVFVAYIVFGFVGSVGVGVIFSAVI